MKNYRVLLFDEEEQFVVTLMNYVNRNSQIPILILAFTNEEEVTDFLKGHKPDLIVVNRKIDSSIFCKEEKIPVIWIVDEWKEQEEEPKEESYIFKYSPASVYVHRMLGVLSEKKCSFAYGKQMNAVAVYSPVGRCGTTGLAKELCRTYSAQGGGKAVLYIGWEEFPSQWDDERRMEQCLYYIKQRTDNISMKLKALSMEKQGYDQLPSGGIYSELRELELEDIRWLMERIEAEGYYDFLVVDVGSGSLSKLEFLTEFNVVYLPYLQELHVEQKISQFVKMMQLLPEWEGFSEKCFPVLMTGQIMNMEQCQLLEQERKGGNLQTIQQVVDEFDRKSL